MIKKIKHLIFRRRVAKAINKANKLKKQYKFKYLVLIVKGRPRVFAKFQLKHLIRTRYFQKGTTIQQLEKLAIYKTN
jgi:hypothetical protein